MTVAIPTRNRSGLMRLALASVLDQTLTDLEVVVVDNASSDDTAEVVASFHDERVTLVRQAQDVGLHGNHTTALHAGTAPYVTVLQDDDLMAPENLERKVAHLDAHPDVGVIGAGFHLIDGDGRSLGPPTNWMGVEGDTEESGREFLCRTMGSGARLHLSTAVFRRTVVTDETFDAEDGGYCEMGLYLRVALRTRVAFLDQPLGSIRLHAASQSTAYGLHVVEGGAVSVTTFEQVRVCRQVKERFLRLHGDGLPVEQLRRTAAAHARHHLGRQIAASGARTRDVRRTVEELRRGGLIEPTLPRSKWAAFSLAATVGGPSLLRLAG